MSDQSATLGAREDVAALVARMFLEVEAVRFYDGTPFTFTSGWASPVYIDCRRLISFPRVRQALMRLGCDLVQRQAGFECFDAVAGGETAGIPFAAWMADRMMLPMQYIRKKPKGFGRNAQIEGHLLDGQRTLLVEDLTTDGRSKVVFCRALRDAGVRVEHVFVLFYYNIFAGSDRVFADMGVNLHYLATWWDVLAAAKAAGTFCEPVLREVEAFLHDPAGWSKAHGGIDKTPD